MYILFNHYENEINDVYQDDWTPDEAIEKLNDEVKKQAKQEVLKGQIKQKDIHVYFNTIKPTLSRYI